jgi:hypothetical protein
MKKGVVVVLFLSWLNGFSQQPIFATISGGNLYSFDLTNCTRHFIGSTGQGFGDIAFTPDGRLWGIISGNLYQIDTATAIASLVGNTGIGGVTLVGLNDTTLLIELTTILYGINTNTAASYLIDTIGYSAAGDLTWYDDDLYMVTSGGRIIRIVLDSTFTSILSVAQIGSSIPTCEGAVTASFEDNYNSIVGFNGPNLIKICQIDGSFSTLCPSLNVGGTPGAASIRLATQIPQPAFCSITGIEDYSMNNLFSIYPNPAQNNSLLTFTYPSIPIAIGTKKEIIICSIHGKEIARYACRPDSYRESSTQTVKLPQMAAGVYVARLVGEGVSAIVKFVVE